MSNEVTFESSSMDVGRPFTKRPFKCHYCRKSFELARSLALHVSCTHKRILGLFTCGVCKVSFDFKKLLKGHLRKHPECRKDANQGRCKRQRLRKRASTKLEKKSAKIEGVSTAFNCPNCARGFSNHRALKVHMQIHVQLLRRFACQVCGNKYVNKRGLGQHMKNKHQCQQVNQSMSVKTFQSGTEIKGLKVPKSKSVKCSECPKVITGNGNLERHMKTHSLQACQGCGKFFQNSMELRKHKYKSRDCQNGSNLPDSSFQESHSEGSELDEAPITANLSVYDHTNIIVIQPISPSSSPCQMSEIGTASDLISSKNMLDLPEIEIDVDMTDLTEAVKMEPIVKENNESEQVSLLMAMTTTRPSISDISQLSHFSTQSTIDSKVSNISSVAQNASNERLNGGLLGPVVDSHQLTQTPVSQLMQLHSKGNFMVNGFPFIQLQPVPALIIYNPYNLIPFTQTIGSNFINYSLQGAPWCVYPHPNNSMVLQNNGKSTPNSQHTPNE